MDSVEVIELSI